MVLDVGDEGVRGYATQAADVNGFDLAVGEQLVEQTPSDAEPLSCLGDREEQALVGFDPDSQALNFGRADRACGNDPDGGGVRR